MAAAVATLLVLSGLLPSCLCLSGQYHFVSQKLNWTEAQKYCRAHYSDLATIESQEDHTRLLKHVNHLGASTQVWIGLYSDRNDWRWSLNDGSLGQKDFKKWITETLDTVRKDVPRLCVLLTNGTWKNSECHTQCPFLCYDANNQTRPNNYVLVTQKKSWDDAQKYCRQHHTDLASARSQEENRQLVDLASNYTDVWFGLFRDTWKWSDQSKFTFHNWETFNPNSLSSSDSVSCVTYKNSFWNDNSCEKYYSFLCQSVTHRQMVKVTFKTSSPLNTSDPAVLAGITEQIRQKLQAEGQPVLRVTWRQQPEETKKTKDAKKKRNKRDEL